MANLQLQKQAIPNWATLPKNSIYADFYKAAGYPTNIPKIANKWHIFEHDILLGIEPRSVNSQLRNPLVFYGFVIDNKTNPVEGRIGLNGNSTITLTYEDKSKVGGLIGDPYWCDTSSPTAGNDYTQWHSDEIITLAANQTVLALDFEHHQPNTWTSAHWTRLGEIFNEVRTACPWVKIGLWARHDATIGPFYDPNNGGVENEAGFNFYAQMYFTGVGNNVSGFYNSGANAAFPFAYLKGRQSRMLGYTLMHTTEVSKNYNPTVLQIPTAWASIESVPDGDGDSADTVFKHNRTDKVITSREKLQTPPSVMFAFSVIGLTVWDGVYWFGTGANYTDDINKADDVGIQPDNNGNSIYMETIRSKQHRVFYRYSYNAFINYTAVANYMCSLEPFKSIIENSLPWILPEYKRITEPNYKTYLQTTPSWCYGNKAPIIRLKFSQDGKKCMYIAVNFSAGLLIETWDFKIKDAAWSGQIQLKGPWLEMGYIDVQNV